jgi:hypothetical protein
MSHVGLFKNVLLFANLLHIPEDETESGQTIQAGLPS